MKQGRKTRPLRSTCEFMSKHVSNPWFIVPKVLAHPRFRVFCLHYAGGNASAFHSWAAQFEQDEINALQLPGRAFRLREPAFLEVSEAVSVVASAMTDQLSSPFVVYGHSMGALLAFELVRELRRAALPAPSALIVSGCRAPHLKRTPPLPADIPDDEFWRKIGELYGTTEELLNHPELKALLLPTFRADFELIRRFRYREEAPLDIPIMACGGVRDPGVPQCDIEAWANVTTGEFSHKMFPGGHMFLQPFEKGLVHEIRTLLDRLPCATPSI